MYVLIHIYFHENTIFFNNCFPYNINIDEKIILLIILSILKRQYTLRIARRHRNRLSIEKTGGMTCSAIANPEMPSKVW